MSPTPQHWCAEAVPCSADRRTAPRCYGRAEGMYFRYWDPVTSALRPYVLFKYLIRLGVNGDTLRWSFGSSAGSQTDIYTEDGWIVSGRMTPGGRPTPWRIQFSNSTVLYTWENGTDTPPDCFPTPPPTVWPTAAPLASGSPTTSIPTLGPTASPTREFAVCTSTVSISDRLPNTYSYYRNVCARSNASEAACTRYNWCVYTPSQLPTVTSEPSTSEPTTSEPTAPTTAAPTTIDPTTAEPTPEPSSATITEAPCPRNCGQADNGGGTCRPSGRCLSCNDGRLRINGRCVNSVSCKGRRIQTGSMTGDNCRCDQAECHFCTRVVSGDTCRVSGRVNKRVRARRARHNPFPSVRSKSCCFYELKYVQWPL